MSVKAAAKAAKPDSSGSLEGPTYLELAEQRKTGNEQNSAKQGKSSKTENLYHEDLSDLAAPDQTDQSLEDKNSDDGEPKTLEEARELLKKERDKAAAGQQMVGHQSKEVGELRQQLADLKARVETQPKKDPPKPLKERLMSLPVMEKLLPASREVMAELVEKGLEFVREDVAQQVGDPLKDQVQGLEERQQRADLSRQVKLMQEEVGTEFVTKNSAAIAQVYQDHEGRLTLEQAAKVVDAEGYIEAKQRKKNAGAKARLATEDGLSRGSGGTTQPARKQAPAGKKSLRDYAAEVMERLGETG